MLDTHTGQGAGVPGQAGGERVCVSVFIIFLFKSCKSESGP